ncbi:MAG: hypothetical protein R2750_12200 [Bacteroidales bacterium]
MKLIRYGIILKRLTINDIEMVRKARNSVRHLMDYKEYITPEMQLSWFKSIDNPHNFYYIINYQNEPVGVIHEKNTSLEPGIKYDDSEGGIFMFEEKYYSSPAPVFAALILIEKGFYIFGDTESVIHIISGNEKAIRFNKSLGYELCPGQENLMKQRYILTKAGFEHKTKKLRKAALKLARSENNFKWVLEKNDYSTGFGLKIEEIYSKAGLVFTKQNNGEKVCIINFPD